MEPQLRHITLKQSECLFSTFRLSRAGPLLHKWRDFFLNDKGINYPIDMFKLFLLCFSLTLWTCVTCYPTGAPLNGYGCHGHVRHNREGSLTDIYPPQYTQSPYKILVNTTHVHKGDIVEGNIFVRSFLLTLISEKRKAVIFFCSSLNWANFFFSCIYHHVFSILLWKVSVL